MLWPRLRHRVLRILPYPLPFYLARSNIQALQSPIHASHPGPHPPTNLFIIGLFGPHENQAHSSSQKSRFLGTTVVLEQSNSIGCFDDNFHDVAPKLYVQTDGSNQHPDHIPYVAYTALMGLRVGLPFALDLISAIFTSSHGYSSPFCVASILPYSPPRQEDTWSASIDSKEILALVCYSD